MQDVLNKVITSTDFLFEKFHPNTSIEDMLNRTLLKAGREDKY